MSEKKRQKKDGEDKNKNNQRTREVDKKGSDEKQQAAQKDINRNPNYK